LEENAALPTDDLEARFKAWVSEHAGAVLKVARAYAHTAEDCQDLVQEILLQIWRSLPRFEGRSSGITWFYRIALNTALSWQRDELRRRSRHNQAIGIEIENVVAESSDCAQHAANREIVERLYRAIHQLPKTDAALVLLYLDELSYREMSEVLGISESNVGVKLNRAKKSLGELMREGNA
jgi:RNA polymerase sigma-70 factor (ECF subfamily)